MANIESGAESIVYDLTAFTESLFLNPKNGEPIEYQQIKLVGKNKTIIKKFDGVDCQPYLLPDNKTVEVEEYKGQGVLWSYCAVYFK